MKQMRWITGEPQGYAGTGASARRLRAAAFGLDHVVCTADAMITAKAMALRPLGFGGSTG